MVLISTFRLPVQIHTRSANAKWLDEIAHTNPLWMHPRDAARLGVRTGDLVRVETEIGYFVVQGVGHRGHPARASSPAAITWAAGSSATTGQRQVMATVELERAGTRLGA